MLLELKRGGRKGSGEGIEAVLITTDVLVGGFHQGIGGGGGLTQALHIYKNKS